MTKRTLLVLPVLFVFVLSACTGIMAPAAPAATEARIQPTQTPFVLVVTATNAPSMVTPTVQPPASTQMPEPTRESVTDFALKGLRFPAYVGNTINTAYDLLVTADGRYYQPDLPSKPERVAHTVAFELPEGRYEFDGVECTLRVDASRNGNGGGNPITVAEGNGLKFDVRLPAGVEYKTAWALAECNGNESTGFQLQYLGPLAAK